MKVKETFQIFQREKAFKKILEVFAKITKNIAIIASNHFLYFEQYF